MSAPALTAAPGRAPRSLPPARVQQVLHTTAALARGGRLEQSRPLRAGDWLFLRRHRPPAGVPTRLWTLPVPNTLIDEQGGLWRPVYGPDQGDVLSVAGAAGAALCPLAGSMALHPNVGAVLGLVIGGLAIGYRLRRGGPSTITTVVPVDPASLHGLTALAALETLLGPRRLR